MTFYEVLTAAVADLTEHGFDSAERVTTWIRKIKEAAIASLVPPAIVEEQLHKAFRHTYHKLVEAGQILERHPGVSKFTLQRVAPRLHAELDRRMTASRELIKLNRAAAIEKTTQRFAGWATSIPPGGTDAADRAKTKTEVRKALASLPFEERRVHIDQAAKFAGNLSEILALDSGAIAGRWASHWRQKNYDYREDHKLRDDKVYVVRGNWALTKGLMKVDEHQYTDEITKPGEEIFCRCSYTWIYSLHALSPGMVTEKGRAELTKAKAYVS